MYTLEKYTWANVSWKIAEEASFVQSDGCRNDLIRVEFVKDKYRLSDLPLDIELKDVTKKSHLDAIGFLTRSTYLGIRKDPRKMLYMVKNPESNKYVAMAEVSQPDYVDVPQPGLFYRFWTAILSRWYRLREILISGEFDHPMKPAVLQDVRDLGRRKCGFYYTPRMVADLKRMSYEQARTAQYPENSSYHLDLFVTRQNEQGKGIGRKLMDMIITDLDEMGIEEPKKWKGPAKMEFFASPVGRGFYLKYGFTLGATFPDVLPSGAKLLHAFFYMNLT